MTKNSQRPDQRSGRKNSKIWVYLSLVLSLAIMAWAFSLPFRNGRELLVSAEEADTEETTKGEGPSRIETAEDYRAAALEMEREFMKARRERLRRDPVPGRREVRRNWQRRVEQTRTQLKQLGEPVEGSVEWQARQELLENLEDAPL